MDNNSNLTNNSGKKKFSLRFNCVDIIIVIALLAIICAFVFRTPSKVSDDSADSDSSVKINAVTYDETAVYTMKISSLQQASGNLIKVGDTLYSHETKGAVGKVTNVRVDPAILYVSLPDGQIVKRYTPDRVDIYLTLEATVHADKSGYYLEGYEFLCANKDMSCYTASLDFIGVVQNVALKDDKVIIELPEVLEETPDVLQDPESEQQ